MKRTPLKRKSTASVSKLKDTLWDLCKQIIRKKYGPTCYTCGKTGLQGGNWHTGHFIHSSLCSVAMRYDLRNLRPQCGGCNVWKSGNTLQYRKNLIRDFGEEYVESLERENQETKGKQYDTLWYQNKIEEYKKL